jgi:integrase
MKKQNGYVYQKGGWWILRYREDVLESGQIIRKQVTHRLEPVAKDHARLKRPPDTIRKAAEKFLRPLNDGEVKPESTQTIGAFVDELFLPQVKQRVRQSTYKGYVGRWESQLKARCGSSRLDQFTTLNAQQVIDSIARQHPKMKRSSLAHLKNLLSLIFDEAERLELLPRGKGNPAKLVRLPTAPDNDETYAYSLAEIEAMLSVLPRPANVVIATAAFAGLRRAELRGLEWPDYDGQRIMVNRSVWESFTNEPKTKRSKAAVPVVARLRTILDNHKLECGNPKKGPIFANGAGKSANLNNTLNREILPVLNRCAICKKAKAGHAGAEHEYRRDDKLPKWHGFHAFRRGLASTLYNLGVDDLMIQAVLRHKDVLVTREHYIKTTSEQSVAAMSKLEAALDSLCTDCAPGTVGTKSALPN